MKWFGLVSTLFLALGCGGVSGADDFDGDGYISVSAGGDDCDDRNSAVNPAGIEVCGDGVDQDCNGSDQACGDHDRDGDGFSPSQGDCNDDNADVNPGASETPYNGIDDDCDAATAEDDLDGDGFSQMGGGDCNDDDDTVFPGADEIAYDDIDQDCSGSDLDDVDSDGHVAVEAGGDDCNDLVPSVHPGVLEVPFDSVDQDCDGSDQVGADFVEFLDSTTSTQYQPDVVRGNGRYLMVWSDRRDNANYNIYGRFFDDSGAPLGDDFEIRNVASNCTYPRVSFDGTNFLVVWQEYTTSPIYYRIHGQRVSAAGANVGTVLTIDAIDGSQLYPEVAFNGTSYLVAWYDSTANPDTIRTRLVQTNGALGTLRVTRVGSQNARNASVASDGTNFLVAWEEDSGDTARRYDIYGQVVKGTDGTNLLVNPAVIGSRDGYQYQPEVAFDGTNYLVMFYDSTQGITRLRGQFVNSSAQTQLSAADENFVISDAGGRKQSHRLTYVDGYYLAHWADCRWSDCDSGYGAYKYDIYGQKVGTDSTLIDTSSVSNFPIVATLDQKDYPTAASDGTNVLVGFSYYGESGSNDVGSLRITP